MIADLMEELRSRGRPGQLEAMARFGLTGEARLGVPMPMLRRMARSIGRNHATARRLRKTGIPDAQILASLVAEPARMTPAELTRWARQARAWDVCDQTCLNTFVHSEHAWRMVREWSSAKGEFVRRAAFALLACLAVHDARAADAQFSRALRLIARAAEDERNAVKKGVNWALRAVGKRNARLRRDAIRAARALQAEGAPASARWIAADALRELRRPQTKVRR